MMRPRFGVSPYTVTMNMKKFNKLSKADQALMLKIGREIEKTAPADFNAATLKEIEMLKEKGVKETHLSPEVYKKMNDGFVKGVWNFAINFNKKSKPRVQALYEMARKNGDAPAKPEVANRNKSGGPNMFLIKSLCRLHDGIADVGYISRFAGPCLHGSHVLLRGADPVFPRVRRQTGPTICLPTCCWSPYFAMIPHASRMGQHISISLLVEIMPSSRTPLRIFTGIFGVGVCLLAAWMSLEQNLHQIDIQQVTEQNRPIPKILMSAWLTFGFFFSSFYFLRAMFDSEVVKPVSWITPGRAALAGNRKSRLSDGMVYNP